MDTADDLLALACHCRLLAAQTTHRATAEMLLYLADKYEERARRLERSQIKPAAEAAGSQGETKSER